MLNLKTQISVKWDRAFPQGIHEKSTFAWFWQLNKIQLILSVQLFYNSTNSSFYFLPSCRRTSALSFLSIKALKKQVSIDRYFTNEQNTRKPGSLKINVCSLMSQLF